MKGLLSQNILDDYSHKNLVPQWASYVLYELGSIKNQNSSILVAPRHFTIGSIQILVGSILREEKHQRLLGKDQLHLHVGGLSLSFHKPLCCSNNHACQYGFLLLPSWKSSFSSSLLVTLAFQDTSIKIQYYLKFSFLRFATWTFLVYRIHISYDEKWSES